MYPKRNLIIDDLEYSDSEIQFIQKNIDKNKKQIYVFRDVINGNEALCAIASIHFSYNEVLCSIGDAYIGENSENPI